MNKKMLVGLVGCALITGLAGFIYNNKKRTKMVKTQPVKRNPVVEKEDIPPSIYIYKTKDGIDIGSINIDDKIFGYIQISSINEATSDVIHNEDLNGLSITFDIEDNVIFSDIIIVDHNIFAVGFKLGKDGITSGVIGKFNMCNHEKTIHVSNVIDDFMLVLKNDDGSVIAVGNCNKCSYEKYTVSYITFDNDLKVIDTVYH